MVDLWADNSIQFPRLLAEIIGVGLSESQWDALLDSMDLESDRPGAGIVGAHQVRHCRRRPA